jgi:phosphate transport system permease protein
VPLTFLFVAHLWQLLPARVSLLLARWRFAFICATLPVGVLLAVPLGPLVERALFAGDLRSWLDGQIGTSVGGWLVMFLPLSALVTALFLSRRVNPMLRRTLRGAGRGTQAIVELLKFVAASAVTIAGALAVAWLLDSLHLDPRGLVLQTYVQRNALVVGFVMGFAIIPLIYTIADDALSTVPGHLRSASLGAGATPWQTAVRVIIPTAMSGLFSAVMIGLGRAVGETMIVLMAAGNTPILDWNIFNGFQTLSASIATELPEAVQGSAHYRTLFIAALALFAMTFVVNTVAEAVRLRFRRRAYEL